MSLNQEKYYSFATQLEQLRSGTIANQLNASQLRQYTTSLRQFFQQQIIPLADEAADSPTQRRVQSYQTEMSKQLRLLEVDVMFLQAARQPSTANVRVDAIVNRLDTLIGYCNAMVAGNKGDNGEGSGEE